jgi:MFS family permease
MKKIAYVVAAASLFAFAPFAERFGPVASSVALVWLGVLLAIFASGFSSTAVGTGALGAFASGVLGSTSPAAAGAVLVLAAFAPRTLRVRTRQGRAVHVLLALVGGGLAGSLAEAYTAAASGVFVVAVLVAAILAALPLLVEADDPLAHALEGAATLVGEPAKRALLDGAALRRSAAPVPLDGPTRARVRTTWQSLLKLADARVRLERSRPHAMARLPQATLEGPPSPPTAADAVLGMLDQRIAEHVSVLGRAYTAVDTVTAARIGLDDSALKTVESMGESLEEVSRALVEVRGSSGG